MFERSIKDPDETLSKNEYINLIESDDNIGEIFSITEHKDNKIRFHIFEDLYTWVIRKVMRLVFAKNA